MTIHGFTTDQRAGDYVHTRYIPDDEVYDDENAVRRFHSPLQKALVLLQHGLPYLNIRNACVSVEPYDLEARMQRLRRRLCDVVCDFRSFNADDRSVQNAPLIGCSSVRNARGIVVGIRPWRTLPVRQIYDSDIILDNVLLGSVIIYTGEQFVAALFRTEHASAEYGEWYSIPPDAIDPFVNLRPEDSS